MLKKCMRTATVVSKNYCTCASLGPISFNEMIERFPEIVSKIKEHMKSYKDKWKLFLKVN
jgi:predicted patatin/cPLA2 family phospholipase